MFKTVRPTRRYGKPKQQGSHSGKDKPGSHSGNEKTGSHSGNDQAGSDSLTDCSGVSVDWYTCASCQELVPVRRGVNVSPSPMVFGGNECQQSVHDVSGEQIVNGEPNVMLGAVDVVIEQQSMMSNVGVDLYFCCRHCKWEQAQNDVIERIVSVEKLSRKLSAESEERNARLGKIEEDNRKLEQLLNDIAVQLSQESMKMNCRLDTQDAQLEALQWRTEMQVTWPKIDSTVSPVGSENKVESQSCSAPVVPKKKVDSQSSRTSAPVVPEKNVENKSTGSSATGVNKLSCKGKFIRKAQKIRKRISTNASVSVEQKVIIEADFELKEDNDSTGMNGSCSNEEKISLGQVCKDKKASVLLIGDSLARGVGCQLESQCQELFVSHAFGGARIEDISKKIEEVQVSDECHVVVMVGTNNLQSDGTAMIMDKYKELVNTLKAKRLRKASIVEILARRDLSNYNNSKRIAMNIQLKELCEKNEIEFLEVAVDRDSMLDSRGLHLNFSGQDKVARSIFKHSVRYLN